jgi:hypothetical protein
MSFEKEEKSKDPNGKDAAENGGNVFTLPVSLDCAFFKRLKCFAALVAVLGR